MENRAHALAAGVFVLVMGMAAALAVIWFRADHQALSRYVLETRHNVGGLNVEAVVRYRGIRAGKVEEIELDPKDPGLVIVRINLDQDLKLTEGTTASLASLGITGLTYILLEDDGSKPAPLEGKNGELPRITLRPTLMDSLTQNATQTLRQISAMTTRLEQVLSEKNTANLARSIDNLARASDDLPQVVAGLKEALSPANMQHLQKTLAHVEKTAGEAAPLTQELRQLVVKMNSLASRAEGLVGGEHESGLTPGTKSTMLRANQMLDELTRTSRQLSRVLSSIEESPESLVFGRSPPRPGPGEAGFGGGEKP